MALCARSSARTNQEVFDDAASAFDLLVVAVVLARQLLQKVVVDFFPSDQISEHSSL